MDSPTHFDVLVLGTSLPNSIAAAALSKAGLTVLHVDEKDNYGGEHATLAPNDFSQDNLPPYARQYAIQLAPALVPAVGPLISAVVASGVSKYGAYKLLDALALFSDGQMKRVPGSKEDVFRATHIGLADKHRLMKFLLFAASDAEVTTDAPFAQYVREEFGLPDALADAVVYALAQCADATESTGPALARVRAFIRSTGRYGNSPFLVAHYGGLGEIAQGFCRTAAVHGAVYILGRKLVSLSHDEKWRIELDGVPDVLTADVLLTNDTDAKEKTACLVALTDTPPHMDDSESSADDALLIFPPASIPTVVRGLVSGARSMSAPQGHWVIQLFYTSPDPDPELLRPYLTTLLPSTQPLWEHTFVNPPPSNPSLPSTENVVRIPREEGLGPATLGDWAAEAAERAFWEVVKRVKGEAGADDIVWFAQDETDEVVAADDDEGW
ncbi:FAD/NAD(P)-binding domain-containing protein [Exidia glandulosa HHB12029]|uniref:FAD/NAD(P)-binding domain-containing protein n=1 Tax=Exidia glandulosa HHB12029 TaxID=1314781 RepID=A0A165ETN1_EXIGL|nr:FAD/NAD(P)-binding domain-containing protein [Exidia glandulosa HHB12029]